MNDETIREQLSALMDGELAPDTARFLSKRLGNDPELLATWERWHGVRDSLRKHEQLAPVDFCARVRDAVETDAAPSVAAPAPTRVWRAVGGMAIAAGVAAVALVLGGPVRAPVEDVRVAEATLAHVAPVTTTDLTPNWRLSPVADRQSYVLAQPQATSEFDSYFLEHGLANGATGAIGVVPYVPMVAIPATGLRESAEQAQAAR